MQFEYSVRFVSIFTPNMVKDRILAMRAVYLGDALQGLCQ